VISSIHLYSKHLIVRLILTFLFHVYQIFNSGTEFGNGRRLL
jgi:hypothetical protein